MMADAYRVIVKGRVQGVAFRWSTLQQARRVGALGFVRNLSDGSVEAWVEGDEPAVNEMRQFLCHGPAGARVDEVVEDVGAPTGATEFAIKY